MYDHDQLVSAIRRNPPVMAEIDAGRKISAIRATRQAFGTGLKEAKDAVEDVMQVKSDCAVCGTTHANAFSVAELQEMGVMEKPHDNPLQAEPWDSVNVQELTDADILTVDDMTHIMESVAMTVRRFTRDGVALAMKEQDMKFLIQVTLAIAQAEALLEKLQKLQGSRMVKVPF